MRYDRARASLDRHATYIVAAYLAGAARQDQPPCTAFAWPLRAGQAEADHRPAGRASPPFGSAPCSISVIAKAAQNRRICAQTVAHLTVLTAIHTRRVLSDRITEAECPFHAT
jgi:hypothetical protein